MVLNLSLFRCTVEQSDGAKHSAAFLVRKRDRVVFSAGADTVVSDRKFCSYRHFDPCRLSA